MRKHLARIGLGLALALSLPRPAVAGGQVDLWVGQKTVADSSLVEHRGLEDQPQVGITSSWQFGWPVAIAVDIFSSSDDGLNRYTTSYGGYDSTFEYDAEIDTIELNVGVRKFWGEKIRPYLGGGVAYVRLDAEARLTDVSFRNASARGFGLPRTVLDDDDSDLGVFANAGISFRIGSKFNLGLDVRYSNATVELAPPRGVTRGKPAARPIDIDAGGFHYGLALGFCW